MHNLQRLWFHPLSKEIDNHFPPGLAAFAGGSYHSYGFGVEMRFIARLPHTVKESLWTQRIWLSANTWNFHHLGLSVKSGVEGAGAWLAHAVGSEANAPGKLRDWMLPSSGVHLKGLSKVHRPQSWEVLSHHLQSPHQIDRKTVGRGGGSEKSVAEKILESEAVFLVENFFLYPLLFCYGLWLFVTWPQPPSESLFWSCPPCSSCSGHMASCYS